MMTEKNKLATPSKFIGQYEAMDFEEIDRRTNYRVISYREDVLHILDKKDTAATIYQIIYRWLVHRRRAVLAEIETRCREGKLLPTPQEVEERMWIYMSYNDFVRETGGAISYNTVIDALNYLVNTKQVVERRANHDPRYSEYEYRINKEVVRQLLQELPEFPVFIPKGGKKRGAKHLHSPKTGTVANSISSPNNGIPTTSFGGEMPNIGREDSQNWGTSQNFSQDSSQNTSQKQQEILPYKATKDNDRSQNTASATLSSVLKKLPDEQIQRILRLVGDSLQPSHLHVSKIIEEPLHTAAQANQEQLCKPEPDASRNVETVVSLVAYLRGKRYTPNARPREIKAARRLLSLQPEYSLLEIEEAWLHGSDDYWRAIHAGDNLHVHDLVNVDSHGQYRVKAFLMHRMAQDRHVQQSTMHDKQKISTFSSLAQPLQIIPKQPVLSEGQAIAIVEQISQNAITYGYNGLHGKAQPEESGWVVCVSWPALSAWKGDVILAIHSARQWEQAFAEWDEILQIRAQKQLKEA